MRDVMELILRKYGRELTLHSRGMTCRVRGFLQPAEKDRTVIPGILGMEDRGRFSYFGPTEPEVLPGDELDDGKDRFVVCQTQRVFGTEQAVYIRGICLRKGGRAPWEQAGWSGSPNC